MKKRVIALALCLVMLVTCLGAGAEQYAVLKSVDNEADAQTQADAEVTKEEYPVPAVNYTNVAPLVQTEKTAVTEVKALKKSLMMSTRATDTPVAPTPITGKSPDGLVLHKTAAANVDGSYTITLEAYATGSKVISQETKDIPADIILVLDQSGSMANDIGTVSFEQYKDESDRWGNITYHTRNQDYYKYRHNGGSANLWHKLSDGSYVSVSVEKTTEYTELSTSLPNYDTNYFGDLTTDCYYYYANNLYEKVGTEHKQVKLTRERSGRTYNYTYTFSDGTTVVSSGNNASPNLGTHSPLYTPSADGSNTVYTYTYTDKDGNVQTIGTSTGASTIYTPAFYQRIVNTSGGESRLDALKTAATNFANQVALKAKGKDGIVGTGDDVKHRIAVVGYAGSSSDLTNGFKQMNDTSQAADVSSAIDNLTANGGTHIDQGLSTANGIFANNPLKATENRNRVIIVFTDGAPGLYGNWGSESVQTANNAITYANTAKKPTSEGGYGATVYTIGIFSGADASNPNSLPTYTKYESGWGGESVPSDAEQVKNSNRFMHLVSSNYPDASSIDQPGNINPNLNGKSYYLSAADSGALNSIFQQISNQIESGGSSTTLSSDAVIKDIISDQFQLPEGTTADNITLTTAACTGVDNNGNYTWADAETATGVTATIDDDTVSVTGFDFSDNWVGTVTNNGVNSYRGRKLEITFKVTPKDGFWGGNNVPTNGVESGVYTADSTQIATFDVPTVNVPLNIPDLTASDKDIYLLGTAPKASELGTFEVPTGAEAWKVDYVNISPIKADKEISNTEDTENINLSVTVTPKYTGEGADGEIQQAVTKTATANVNVFKPEITFQDSTINLGQTPDYATDNYVSVVWKHGDKNAKDADMTGSAPDLSYTYSPAENDTDAFKTDTYVKATVKIGETPLAPDKDVTFKHNDCSPDCGFDSSNGQFIVHINTFDLTITKSITRNESKLYGSQDFVFNVKCEDKNIDIDVVVNVPDEKTQGSVTIKGLPVGTYTVTENTGWSWRYNLQGAAAATGATGTVVYNNDGSSAKYTPSGTNNEIVFTNSWVQAKWLSFTDSWKNIFREPNT